jgi:hypothetical protein
VPKFGAEKEIDEAKISKALGRTPEPPSGEFIDHDVKFDPSKFLQSQGEGGADWSGEEEEEEEAAEPFEPDRPETWP